MSSLENKIIWITGASSGIGEALTLSLARKGARLIISARRESELERVKNMLPEELQQSIHILPFDLANHSSLSSTTKTAINYYGRIDILVNNAGVSQRSLISETDFQVDQSLINTNYLGTVCLSKNLLPHFISNRSGHFVTITSLVGKFGSKYRSSYSASKHALHGFFESLDQEHYQDGIHVTMVCPGFVRTNVSVNALTGDGTPLNRMDNAQAKGMDPEKCARKIISAIEKKKFEVYIGGKEVLMIWLKRFIPTLARAVIRRSPVR